MQEVIAREKTVLDIPLAGMIKHRTAKVGTIGLGYVGLPLAIALSREGFPVTGIELNESKVERVNDGDSYIGDVPSATLGSLVRAGKLKATADESVLKDMDVVIICVPTPISRNKTPDLSYVEQAAAMTAEHVHENQLIILESTTHPGTTEEVVLPILEASGLKVGEQFYLAFSPERVDPGNKRFSIHNTPKVIGGVTENCGLMAELLYGTVAEKTVRVSSAKVAETTKLFENVFRNVNIALVNELTILCGKMGISACEVIEAASSKPFGFTRFDPGPGVGGHCIPVDPYYLATKAKEYDFHSRFIESAGEVNENMPYFVVDRIWEALNRSGKSLRGSRILVLGVAYKKDIEDLRESPSLKIIGALFEKGAEVVYNDPYVPEVEIGGRLMASHPLTGGELNAADCAVIVTDHSDYDYEYVAKQSKLLLDTRNATKHLAGSYGHIIRF